MALAHAILAALLDTRCSGYDLRKQFETSVGYFWQASFQQIYRELSKLEEQGLVRSEAIAQQGRPDKKIFTITTAGESFLQEWVEASCEISPLRDELLVKMFAGYLVPKETMLRELERHRTLHQERLTIYREIEESAFGNSEARSSRAALFRYLTLRRGILFEENWLVWLEEAIAALQV